MPPRYYTFSPLFFIFEKRYFVYEMHKILDANSRESETAGTILEKAISGIMEITERNADFNHACYQRPLHDESFALGLTKERLEFSDLLGAQLMEHLDHHSRKNLRRRIDFCLTVTIATLSDSEVASNLAIPEKTTLQQAIDRELA